MKRTPKNICPMCDAGDPCSVVTSCDCQEAPDTLTAERALSDALAGALRQAVAALSDAPLTGPLAGLYPDFTLPVLRDHFTKLGSVALARHDAARADK